MENVKMKQKRTQTAHFHLKFTADRYIMTRLKAPKARERAREREQGDHGTDGLVVFFEAAIKLIFFFSEIQTTTYSRGEHGGHRGPFVPAEHYYGT